MPKFNYSGVFIDNKSNKNSVEKMPKVFLHSFIIH